MCGDDSKVDEADGNAGDATNNEVIEKYGPPKKYDPEFKGPTDERWCTDVICCFLFFIFVALSVVCTIFGYRYGNAYKLIYPTDSNGVICGIEDMKDKPNLMFFDILQCAKAGPLSGGFTCPTPQVCVANCTDKYYHYLQSVAKEIIPNKQAKAETRKDMICINSVNPIQSQESVEDLVKSDKCARYYIPSSPVIGRCVPKILSNVHGQAKKIITQDNVTFTDTSGSPITFGSINNSSKALAIVISAAESIQLVFKDILASWYIILIFCILVMIVTFLWIILMRWIAGIMVWLAILAFIALFAFITVHSLMRYVDIKNDKELNNLPIIFTTNLSYYTKLKETWLAFGIIGAAFLLIILLLTLCLCERIRIAVELIKEGSRAVGSMMFTLIFPIFPFVFQLGLVVYYGFSAAYVATMGRAEYQNSTNMTGNGIDFILDQFECHPNSTDFLNNVCQFVKYGGDRFIIPMQIYLLFMFFWLNNFIIAFGQMTLAGAFASYYWAFHKPKDIPMFPILKSIWRCFRYHLGSLAFGSLIIALVQMIRAFLEYLDHKLKDTQNPVARYVLMCLKCCFWCLEKVLKFINRNAYIMIAVHGKNFCISAKDALSLIMRNIIRTVVLDKITDFLFFISKLVIVAGAVCGSFFWFQGSIPFFDNYRPQITYYFAPVILVAIGAYLITSTFFSVYAMAIDTLFLCFLEDLERNDGSPEKPYRMSKGLKKILGKRNKSQAV